MPNYFSDSLAKSVYSYCHCTDMMVVGADVLAKEFVDSGSVKDKEKVICLSCS